jgi:hypothetical protein
MIHCKNCNAALEDDAKVCTWCGKEVEQSVKTKVKKMPLYIILGIVIPVLLLLCLFIPMLSHAHKNSNKQQSESNSQVTKSNPSKDGSNNSVSNNQEGPTGPSVIPEEPIQNLFYLKGNSVYQTGMNRIQPKEVIHDLYHKKQSIDPIYVSNNGKKLFYYQNHKAEVKDYTVMGYLLNLQKEERDKVLTEVKNYVINQEGTKIFYYKKDDLFVSDLSKSKLIDLSVKQFYINKEGSRIIYVGYDNSLNEIKDGQKKEVLAKDVTLQYVSPDLNTIYYIQTVYKDGIGSPIRNLYLLKSGKDAIEIAKEIKNVLCIFKSGEVYYSKYPVKSDLDNEIYPDLKDYINDDLAKSDESIVEPNDEDYADPADPELEKKLKQYYEKYQRDELRKNAGTVSVEPDWYSLYCYADGESKLVMERCVNVWTACDQDQTFNSGAVYCDSIQPRVIICEMKDKNFGKMKISEIDSIDTLNNFVWDGFRKKQEYYICDKATVLKKIGEKYLSGFSFNPKKDELYYVKKREHTDLEGDLNHITIKGNKASDAILKEKKVSAEHNYFVGNTFVYYKNVDEVKKKGEMYYNGTLIDKDVSFYHPVETWGKNDNFIYFKNEGDWYDEFSIVFYNNGEKLELPHKIINYIKYSNQQIVFLTAPESNGNLGNLYMYKGTDQIQPIDSSVDTIITPEQNTYFLIRE